GDDAHCPQEKTYWMLKCMLLFYDRMVTAVQEGTPLERILDPGLLERIARAKEWRPDEVRQRAAELLQQIENAYDTLGAGGTGRDSTGQHSAGAAASAATGKAT
ncbi:MAG: hypothetical protein ACM30E_08970, partial [Nitrososphaerales archaeon]